jgi:hypothetical protein
VAVALPDPLGHVGERALERGGFDCVQATHNLLERSAGPALERELDELAEPSDRYWSKRSELNWN